MKLKQEIIGCEKCIEAFIHCGMCIEEDLMQDIECGWTEKGLQIWCRNHDCNIIHIDFKGKKLPANTSVRVKE